MLWHDVFDNICYRCANICKVRTMNMCYVMFMLTVCWAMNIYVMLTGNMYFRVPFYTRTTFRQKQTIQDIQPSTRPRINISQVPAGRFLLFLFVMLFFELFYVFVFVFLYVFFDCKCKRLKRLGENIKQNKQNINNNKKTTLRNNYEKSEIQDIQPSTRPRINISQVPAGRFLLFCCYVFMLLL